MSQVQGDATGISAILVSHVHKSANVVQFCGAAQLTWKSFIAESYILINSLSSQAPPAELSKESWTIGIGALFCADWAEPDASAFAPMA